MLLLACFIGLPTSVEFIKSDRKTFYINTASTVHMTTSIEVRPKALVILLKPRVQKMLEALVKEQQSFEDLCVISDADRVYTSTSLSELELAGIVKVVLPPEYRISRHPNDQHPAGLFSRLYDLRPEVLGRHVEALRGAASFYEGLLSPASTE